jgi:hypothetical protein
VELKCCDYIPELAISAPKHTPGYERQIQRGLRIYLLNATPQGCEASAEVSAQIRVLAQKKVTSNDFLPPAHNTEPDGYHRQRLSDLGAYRIRFVTLL